jgi:hypothetical protein
MNLSLAWSPLLPLPILIALAVLAGMVAIAVLLARGPGAVLRAAGAGACRGSPVQSDPAPGRS